MTIPNQVIQMRNLEADMWFLLLSERTVTLYANFPDRFPEAEKQAARKRYQELSMKVFGQIRDDRK